MSVWGTPEEFVEKLVGKSAPHGPKRRLPTTEQDDRWTLPATAALARQWMGVDRFTLDVAACEGSHLAERWCGPGSPHGLDGLVEQWSGDVWCNPPFTSLKAWVECAWRNWHGGTRVKSITLLSPCNRTDQSWWQDLVEPKRDRPYSPLRTRFLRGRTRFGSPDDPRGERAGSPPFGVVLLGWSSNWSQD